MTRIATLQEFLDSGASLVAVQDERIVFRSDSSDLRPLLELIIEHDTAEGGLLLFDKYVGRAAALLMTRLRPAKVFAGIISVGGAETLRRFGVEFEAGEKVKYLMGVASDGMCRFEKMALGKSPDEFWTEITSLPEFQDVVA